MKNQAFTLIELLVVVLIIGILAAIAVPQYQKAVVKSQFATMKFLIKDIVQAQEAYYLAHGKYSENFEDLDITMPMPNGIDGHRYTCDWGFCAFANKHHVECKNNNINMALDFYYYYSWHPNQHICVVHNTTDSNDYRNSICQEDTGAKEGSVSDEYNVIFWHYK